MEEAYKAYEILSEKGKNITLINARFLKPLDEDMLREAASRHHTIITVEEQAYEGGFGQAVSAFYMRNHITDITVKNIAIEDTFVEHGRVEDLRKILKLDADSIVKTVEEFL
mgnify:FL=1